MPVYVMYNGQLIDKRQLPLYAPSAASNLPAPSIMALEPYHSPVSGQTISSHRQRERDLNNSGSYDPRDTPAAFRKAQDGRRKSKRSPAEPQGHR